MQQQQQNKITPAQLTKLHCVLNERGLMDDKKALIYYVTEGRTDSSRQLTFEEARELISVLCTNDPRQRHIKAIWMLAHQAGIIYGHGEDDNKMNAAKLDQFLKSKGTVKKQLSDMNLAELKKVHRQFEAVLGNTERSKAKKATDSLLAELGITTSK